MQFIIAQIIAAIVLVLTVICIQQKTKEKILIYQIIANILDGIQWLLLTAITGGVIGFLNALRCVIFYWYKKKNKKPSALFLVIFIFVVIGCGVISWQNMYSIIPIAAGIIFTYGLWQDNVTITRICTALSAGSLSVYGLVFKGFVRAVGLIAECASAIVAIIRHDILKNKN